MIRARIIRVLRTNPPDDDVETVKENYKFERIVADLSNALTLISQVLLTKSLTHAIKKGMPVFQTLSNAEHALAVLSADDDRARSYSGPDQVRAKKAVALAFLLHGREAA